MHSLVTYREISLGEIEELKGVGDIQRDDVESVYNDCENFTSYLR